MISIQGLQRPRVATVAKIARVAGLAKSLDGRTACEQICRPLVMIIGSVRDIPMIAIVDDDNAVREAMKLLMRSLGYHASTFGCAEDFLQSEQVHDTSCLITDVQMPGLSGLDLQDRLVARGHRISIIFITGYPDENARMRAMKAGAIGFLTKPVNTDHLVGHIEKALKAA